MTKPQSIAHRLGQLLGTLDCIMFHVKDGPLREHERLHLIKLTAEARTRAEMLSDECIRMKHRIEDAEAERVYAQRVSRLSKMEPEHA
jgi:hypothetical protein